MKPNLGELIHGSDYFDRAGEARRTRLLVAVEPEILNVRAGERTRNRSGQAVVRETEIFQSGEGIEDFRDGSGEIAASGVESDESGRLSQIGRKRPWSELRVGSEREDLEAGEAGEGAVWDGGEVVVVKIDCLKIREVGEGRKLAGELVSLEGESGELRERVEVRR